MKITDSDAAHALDSANVRHKIRLQGIDAPERKQAFGKRSKEYLSDLVAGEPVVVDWSKRDWYKRIVGKIIYRGKDINLEMVKAGMAWWYRKYANEQNARDRVLYEAAEKDARESWRGLWVDTQPMVPCIWRKTRQTNRGGVPCPLVPRIPTPFHKICG